MRSSDVEALSQSLWMGIHGITSLLITQKHFPFVGKKRLIADTIAHMTTSEQVARSLVDDTLKAGGTDNVTVLMLQTVKRKT